MFGEPEAVVAEAFRRARERDRRGDRIRGRGARDDRRLIEDVENESHVDATMPRGVRKDAAVVARPFG